MLVAVKVLSIGQLDWFENYKQKYIKRKGKNKNFRKFKKTFVTI